MTTPPDTDPTPSLDRDDEIFGAALELPPHARAGFLTSVCKDDAALRGRIESLLAAYDQAGEFLENPAVGRVGSPADEKPGDVIDRYTLVKKIGEGGCGSVYLAEQRIPVRRQVALKIIKLGMDTRQVIARFEGERQALAMMDHPDIARVLDAGATDTGRPFFVMDYVDGVPINTYCDAHSLPVAARLELFVRVCLALQHAHQKGIIHRDVKPSNILVTTLDGSPVPKIIDFGIAKATQGRLTEQTLLTGVDQFLGTPAYMSPEQADLREADVDTRSDVYSLGVLLYVLLVGRLPFESNALQQVGIDKVRRLIREAEPPRPSARFAALADDDRAAEAARRGTTAAALATALRDDLDWIVVRCIEKDRDRRYGSAQELADDIRRHLNHEPVSARPPTTAYRAQRFVARHRLACASAAAIAASLLTGTVVSVRQAVRATKAEHAARAERDAANAATRIATQARGDAQRRQEEAEDLLTFMLGNFRAELKNVHVAALDAVDNKAMAYFAALDPRDLTDTVLTRQAKALYQIGETRMDEARYADAFTAFTASYARAAALVDRHPRDADMLFERAQAEYWLGFVARRRGDFTEAREWLTRYRDSALALVSLEKGKLRAQREQISGYHNLAVLDFDLGDLEASRRGFVAEREVVARTMTANPNDFPLRFFMADAASWLGSIAEADGHYAEAIKHFSESVARVEELVKLQPAVTRWRLRLADNLALTADAQAMLGDRTAALTGYEESKTLREALVAHDPQNRQWLHGALYNRLKPVAFHLADSKLTEAALILTEVREKMEELVKAEPTSSVFTATLATAWRLEARLRFARGQSDAADAVARAIELSEPLVKEARANDRALGEFAQSCLLAGRIEHARGNFAEARRAWERALAPLIPRLTATRDWRLLDPAVQALVLLQKTDEARPLADRLSSFGYHALDPLAASTIDSASSPASSNRMQ